MQNLPHSFTKTDSDLDVAKLIRYAERWLMSGDIDQHSQRTLGSRRDIVDKLLWFLKHKNLTTCGTHELRQFLAYLTHGHTKPGGRWGNPHMTKPVHPRTVHTYHGHLRTLFRWIVAEGDMPVSPMERIPVPTSRADQIQPFTSEHVNALLHAAKQSRHARRDEAILLFLLDTGIRASELCSLKVMAKPASSTCPISTCPLAAPF
jgi:site-specific recombinase XerD